MTITVPRLYVTITSPSIHVAWVTDGGSLEVRLSEN